MTDLTLFRVYEPFECGRDGYPHVWHSVLSGPNVGTEKRPMTGGVKDIVRDLAGHRCERCGHPYRPGVGEWAPPEDVKVEPDRLDRMLAVIEDGKGEPDERSKKRTPFYSPCDDRCSHGGPARARVTSDRPWQAKETVPAGLLRQQIKQGIEVQAAWRILTVHHLNGVKADLRWWNLASLCQRCHLVIQRKVQMERVYPLEHTPWFKPHAAGWYAYAYEGKSLTREDVVADLDRLLGLERML